MDSNGFRKFLETRKIGDEKIEVSLRILQDFDGFLQKKGKSVDMHHVMTFMNIQNT